MHTASLALLHFLHIEIYAAEHIVTALLEDNNGLVCTELSEYGYVRTVFCPEISELLWGISYAGQRYCAAHMGMPLVKRAMGPSFRYPLTTVFHKIGVQDLLVPMLKGGGVLCASARGRAAYMTAIPDAVVQFCGRRYAIEYERVLKARSRYPEILSHRLQAIKRGDYDFVVWVFPDETMCARAQTWLYAIDWVPVASTWVQIRSLEHHARIACVSAAAWPFWLQEIATEHRE